MSADTSRHIYLDHAATTPCDPRVVEAMLPYFTDKFGNSGSRNHAFGWEAEDAIEHARKQVATVIGADPKEVIFTSGSTESNNIAIKGAAYMYAKAPAGSDKRGQIITAMHEHKAVLDPCKRLQREGFDVTYIEPGEDGLITAELVKNAMRDDTILVSIMWANNEIGTINEIPQIGALCKERGVLLHTDATQWVGKMPTNVEKDNVDLLSLSGHKIYGPKGVGALYVRRRKPRVRLQALVDGGGQERNFRSGTLNTTGIVGLGKACEIAAAEMDVERERLFKLRQKIENELTSKLDVVKVNGHPDKRLANITNISFGFVEGEGLMMALARSVAKHPLAVSSGSACTSASLEPSYVLKALGVGDELAHSSLRISLGRWNTEEEVDYAIAEIVDAVSRLRELSPLYDMHQEGIDISKIEWQAH
ncbi:MAG: IscS subfamily cysteine desulfurase [Phycisphaeraceae bacterium]|nr:IscS subfamily cysteine desulfurase [Phycisphaerales bacterium]MCB9859104.1 IscS subfamily cysteine desulfurase [Phycisphaeraceae bacterium]